MDEEDTESEQSSRRTLVIVTESINAYLPRKQHSGDHVPMGTRAADARRQSSRRTEAAAEDAGLRPQEGSSVGKATENSTMELREF